MLSFDEMFNETFLDNIEMGEEGGICLEFWVELKGSLQYECFNNFAKHCRLKKYISRSSDLSSGCKARVGPVNLRPSLGYER